jgi:LPS export ABC transporter protein LptC
MMKWYIVMLIGIVAGGLSLVSGGWPPRATTGPAIVPEPSQDPTALPNAQVREMSLIAQIGSAIAWHVFAQQATFSEAAQRTVVQQVSAMIFPDTADAWHLTAARGVLDSATGDMAIEGQVRLQHRDGYTIETDELRWQAAGRRLYSEAPVTMRSASGSITGTGLRSPVDQHRIILQHDVRAVFRLPGNR